MTLHNALVFESMPETVIALVANGSFALPLSVTIGSLSRFHHDRVVVVHDEFSADDRARVERAAPDAAIEWLEVPEADRERFPGAVLHRSTWYRLLLPRLLPEAARILYLDADILVVDPIEELLDADLEGRALGAVQNLRAPYVSSVDGLTAWQHLDLDPALPYFNAGVLLIDADRWRRDDVESTAIATAHDLYDRGLLPMADQDTLNAVFAGAWTELDFRFNQHPLAYEPAGAHHRLLTAQRLEALRTTPAIVHFIGRAKPWVAGCKHPFTAAWRAEVSRDGFPDFRPEAPSAVDRVVGRLRRSGQALLGR